jgi:hypothetical protein
MSKRIKKDLEPSSKVDSWYPSADQIVLTQREQVVKAREEAAAFASRKFGRTASPWWRRLFGAR